MIALMNKRFQLTAVARAKQASAEPLTIDEIDLSYAPP